MSILFQDGNCRVGRLLLFKECLRFGMVPFIITDNLKALLLPRSPELGN